MYESIWNYLYFYSSLAKTEQELRGEGKLRFQNLKLSFETQKGSELNLNSNGTICFTVVFGNSSHSSRISCIHIYITFLPFHRESIQSSYYSRYKKPR